MKKRCLCHACAIYGVLRVTEFLYTHMIRFNSCASMVNCTFNQVESLTLLKEDIVQDALKLGINTNTDTYQVKKADGSYHSNVFTLGGNLKGELWESTAVNELRIQTERLAEQLKVVENNSVTSLLK